MLTIYNYCDLKNFQYKILYKCIICVFNNLSKVVSVNKEF